MRVRLNTQELAVLSADPRQPWLSYERMVWAGLMYENASPGYCYDTKTHWYYFTVVDDHKWMLAVMITGVQAERLC